MSVSTSSRDVENSRVIVAIASLRQIGPLPDEVIRLIAFDVFALSLDGPCFGVCLFTDLERVRPFGIRPVAAKEFESLETTFRCAYAHQQVRYISTCSVDKSYRPLCFSTANASYLYVLVRDTSALLIECIADASSPARFAIESGDSCRLVYIASSPISPIDYLATKNSCAEHFQERRISHQIDVFFLVVAQKSELFIRGNPYPFFLT